jgi:glycosyltransferase involved in cell wall biosynthesis
MKFEFERYTEFVKLIKLPELTSAQTQTKKDNLLHFDITSIDFSSTNAFAQELNDLNIDILHINNSVFSLIYDTITKRTKVKIISHVREWIHWNGINFKQKFIIDAIKNNSDAIICISDVEAEVFDDYSKLHVVPNPFDFDEIENLGLNSAIRKEVGLSEDELVVGMIGRAQENKGFLDFLRVANYLNRKYPNMEKIKFLILGGFTPKKTNLIKVLLRKLLGKSNFSYELYKFYTKNKLSKTVTFLNNRKNVLNVIKTFDIAVRPSYSGDPWGRDIIEYMALKKPVVATGKSEFYIKNGITGFLVEPRNFEMLGEKIFWLNKNNDRRTQMGETAFNEIFYRCNLKVFKTNINKVYESLFNVIE